MTEQPVPSKKIIRSRLLTALLVLFAVIVLELASYLLFHYSSSLERIKRRDTLIVLTENNANSYYLYREAPMGFEYELVRNFADYLEVDLKIKTPGWSRLFEFLRTDRGDLIAAGMTRTVEREALADFSDSYMTVQQQVVVHKNNYTIENIHDLAGYTIHVREGTTYENRLKEIQNEGIPLTIVSHRDIPTEELIQLVAARKIPVTIADSNIALLNRRYYPEIKIACSIEAEQSLAWAVRRGEKSLLNEINDFLKMIKTNGTLERIYHQYYSAVDSFDYVDLKTFHQRLETRLPQYRDTIKRQAERYDFDWRLIAAVIYQESHFDPEAVSYTGAMGLMQLTEATALDLGVDNPLDPFQSIRGGVRYLSQMRAMFDDVADPHTRLQFALASYNLGYGHVLDARRLAREQDLDDTSWQAMKTVLPLLRDSEYYTATRYGYARGTEAVYYVESVLTYYDILKQKALEFNKIDAEPSPSESPPVNSPEPAGETENAASSPG